jgi:hypothetical protein
MHETPSSGDTATTKPPQQAQRPPFFVSLDRACDDWSTVAMSVRQLSGALGFYAVQRTRYVGGARRPSRQSKDTKIETFGPTIDANPK